MIASYYWEKASKDFTIPKEERLKFVKTGLESVDKALQLKPDYLEAWSSKGCCSARRRCSKRTRRSSSSC
jgi:hypothetical protein